MPELFAHTIEDYAAAHSSPEPPHLAALANETRTTFPARAGMMVGHLEGRLLNMLVAMLRPRAVLEIGCFTGYSALSMAEALPSGGHIITCEVSEEHAAIARRYIAASPYADRITIRMGPALETLATLDGPFDFVFIDADKTNYANYLEAVLPRLSAAGTVAVDNVLWYGRIFDDTNQDPDTIAIRNFNELVRNDPRLECVLLPVRDGLTLIRRTGRE